MFQILYGLLLSGYAAPSMITIETLKSIVKLKDLPEIHMYDAGFSYPVKFKEKDVLVTADTVGYFHIKQKFSLGRGLYWMDKNLDSFTTQKQILDKVSCWFNNNYSKDISYCLKGIDIRYFLAPQLKDFSTPLCTNNDICFDQNRARRNSALNNLFDHFNVTFWSKNLIGANIKFSQGVPRLRGSSVSDEYSGKLALQLKPLLLSIRLTIREAHLKIIDNKPIARELNIMLPVRSPYRGINGVKVTNG